MSGCDRRGADDTGFTLVEVLVAMMLLAVVMLAAIPALVGTLKSTTVTRMSTQAKNLSQERMDQLRNLRFHVDRQNGPFLDVLDIYYTNATTGVTTVNTNGGTVTGKYVASGSLGAGEPTGPYYRTETGALPNAGDFSQVITTQFLAPDGSAIPATRFTGYDSQAVGKDQPPSLMLGVTIITKWIQSGQPKSYTASTRITDGKPQLPLIQSQARAVAVQATSTDHEGRTLEVQGGVASLDGAQSSGSSVSGFVAGAVVSRSGTSEVTGASVELTQPGSGAVAAGSGDAQPAGVCDWYGFGRTATSNVTGDISSGLPKAPTNVDAASPANMAGGYLLQNGAGPCGQLSFHNVLTGGTQVGGSTGALMGAAPFVTVPDAAGSGASIRGDAYVTSNAVTATPKQTKAGARVAMANPVVVFPGSTAGGAGLVKARVQTARVDCVSGAATGTVSGSYTVELQWWGKAPTDTSARWHMATWTYNSTSGAPSRSGDTWDPANTEVAVGVNLADLVEVSGGGTPASVTTGASNGLRGFPNGIVTITTAPTLQNEFAVGYSAINVVLGQLACVADDRR